MTPAAAAPAGSSGRIVSVDALRGFVMFTMIYVNDIAGGPDTIVPAWMKHFHGRSGMTFVDLVFPAFLFIVGMSIPFGLGARLDRGEPRSRIVLHILTRTLALLAIGILMVNESPDPKTMGWSASLWSTLMYLCAILAFSDVCPPAAAADEGRRRRWHRVSLGLRAVGLAGLAWLALVFRGEGGRRIVTLSPFSIHTEWYGILGLIGWAYLVGSLVYLLFRGNRAALLGCVALLLCLYPAARAGMFEGSWLARHVGIGEMLGSQASITAAGILLASVLRAPDSAAAGARFRFALWFAAGFAAAAVLLDPLYGINKNQATPSWCLWSCAITALLWLMFYWITDVHPVAWISRPFALAGRNVLLAYLISEMLPSALSLAGAADAYGRLAALNLPLAMARSIGCAVLILVAAAWLNRAGFRLKL